MLIKINEEKETFNTNKELASNDKERINIDRKTISDDTQTNLKKNNCNENIVTNINNNNTILQINVDNNEITSKDTLEHQNKNDDQEELSLSQKSQNAPPNEKETSKKTKKNKKSSADCKRIYIIGVHKDIHNPPRLIFFQNIPPTRPLLLLGVVFYVRRQYFFL